ncbi:MAG TPA: MATE family efflux transporter [Labilithrix sp.]|nr:MATE family efflux transporter [Labilithrix sp.]
MANATADVDIELISGPPYRTILRLALPTVVAMLSQSVVNEVDVFFFTKLPHPEDSNAQAALLPSLLLVWLFGGSLSAISVGTQALTARRYAERKYDAAGAVLANAAFFCLVAGIFLAFLGAATIHDLLGFILKVPEAHAIAFEYSKWRLLGIVSMAGTMALKAFFDGIGKTWVHLVSAVVMNVFNILFCWIFIFGKLGAPRMGAPGAGFAAFVATWIGLGIMIFYLAKERKRFSFLRRENLSRALTWDILKLSIPAALATVVMMVGFALFAQVAGKLDAAEAASSPSGAREAVNGAATTDIVAILKLTFTACIAFGTATATLVAQALAAKRPNDADRFGWASVRLGLVLFGVVGFFEGVLFTPQIVNFISHSEAVRQAAIGPLRMMGVITPIIAVAMILSEALFGAGNTKFVAAAQFCLVFFVLVPLAWVLGIKTSAGLTGMWGAAACYCVGAAIVMTLKFRGGSWKKIEL